MKKTATVIEKLKNWRSQNGLSQRAAAAVLAERDFEITLSSLQKWEEGVVTPGRFTAKCLEAFLKEHPVIKDAPRYGRWVETTSERKVAEIREAREKGLTLKAIAQAHGLSESSVCRIIKGNRRAAARK